MGRGVGSGVDIGASGSGVGSGVAMDGDGCIGRDAAASPRRCAGTDSSAGTIGRRAGGVGVPLSRPSPEDGGTVTRSEGIDASDGRPFAPFFLARAR